MIYGKLEKINQYKNLHPNLKIAIEWLEKQNLENLELGKYEIKEKDVFALRMDVDAYDDQTVQYETHNVYSDLHIIIDDEMFYYDDKTELGKEKTEYNVSDDYQLFEINNKNNLLKPRINEFLLFLPGDGHAPKYNPKVKKLKKIVIKIKW
ncbi:YhcH/YjgK/YiaL family protein [Mesomycoplasma neurolyticum]|uniref:Beta-galactosidase-like protein n=1 Tax=Mesomycoplasma neurolyticum TaxID=2120 RepID=A0A449A4X7_9BACT|nr:YhcH/YjgK/YiaL family protein [Mesomycoplasma neurolyticum]VEU59287.1 beta-galactosidase-like protein [Mesomycoplasma neurolyticum]